MGFEDTVPLADAGTGLALAPRPPAAPVFETAPPERRPEPSITSASLRFDGTGSEYFRIWVVNLLLSLVTLGIYSAWAKVRKARWFAQHTELLGDRFDFHGDPLRILFGRGVAIVLVLAWSHAFDVSLWFGVAMALALCAAGPLLFASAQRFRLANTSWRGLRFRFDAPVSRVYRVGVPMVVAWTGFSLMAAFELLERKSVAAAVFVAYGIGLPWAHAQLKRMQHEYAWFGSRRFGFAPAGKAIYGLYLKALLVTVLATGAAVALVSVIAASGARLRTVTIVSTALVLLLMWAAIWPYFAARMQQIVWSRTRWGHTVRFEGRMRFWPLWRLTLGQALLTIATAGLYWPFAAVALARYRIESIRIESDEPLDGIVTLRSVSTSGSAGGDASLETFGLDIGW